MAELITFIPWFLVGSAILGLIWALLKARSVLSIELGKSDSFNSYRILSDGSDEKIQAMKSIGAKIEAGASSFLK